MYGKLVHWKDSPNGKLVISAGSRTFRVDRGYVAKHCPTLVEALLSKATFDPDGVAHAKTDVDALDLDLFLPFTTGAHMDGGLIPPRTLLALERINAQYKLPRIYTFSEKQMNDMFPTTFDGWKKHYIDTNAQWLTLTGGDEFKLLSTVSISGVKKYLPTSYLLCVTRRTLFDISLGRDEKSGPVYLSEEQKHVLVKARDVVTKKATEHIYGWYLSNGHPSPNCTNKGGCDIEIAQVLNSLADGTVRATDMLFEDLWHAPPGILCRGCDAAEEESRIAGMELFFEGLPVYFGMGSWADLV